MLSCRITFCSVNDCYNHSKYVDNVMQKEVWVVATVIVRSHIEIFVCFIVNRFCVQQWHAKLGEKVRTGNLIILRTDVQRRLLHFY
jgi:hypothetical protein